MPSFSYFVGLVSRSKSFGNTGTPLSGNPTRFRISRPSQPQSRISSTTCANYSHTGSGITGQIGGMDRLRRSRRSNGKRAAMIAGWAICHLYSGPRRLDYRLTNGISSESDAGHRFDRGLINGFHGSAGGRKPGDFSETAARSRISSGIAGIYGPLTFHSSQEDGHIALLAGGRSDHIPERM